MVAGRGSSVIGSVLSKAWCCRAPWARSDAAGKRLDAAEDKIQLIHRELEDIEDELIKEVADIDARLGGGGQGDHHRDRVAGEDRREGYPHRVGWVPVA